MYSGLPKSGFNRSLGLRVFLSTFCFFFTFPYRGEKMKEWGRNGHGKVPAMSNAGSSARKKMKRVGGNKHEKVPAMSIAASARGLIVELSLIKIGRSQSPIQFLQEEDFDCVRHFWMDGIFLSVTRVGM
ncbi:hypothetical protein CEXT_55611 [Caerostris extrusa]|uniref:Uncharacterized protein n=1 Tax=Caerostris extrusa TaxID=172846 RepID=A0AAV4NCU1_CAEEX|nr:hypothetical protein CEXT_55611 [Caerostris extrusa]